MNQEEKRITQEYNEALQTREGWLGQQRAWQHHHNMLLAQGASADRLARSAAKLEEIQNALTAGRTAFIEVQGAYNRVQAGIAASSVTRSMPGTHVVSDDAKREVVALTSSSVLLVTVEITHPDFPTLRYVNDTKAFTGGGITYAPYPFEFTAPPAQDGALPSTVIVFDDITQAITVNFGKITAGSPTAEVSVFLHDQPTNPIYPARTFDLTNMSSVGGKVSCALKQDSVLANNLNGFYIDPLNFPGLFMT